MRRRDGNQRDPAIERLWFRVALITVDDLGKPFPPGRGPMDYTTVEMFGHTYYGRA